MIYAYAAFIIVIICLLVYMGLQFVNNCEEHDKAMTTDDLIDYDN